MHSATVFRDVIDENESNRTTGIFHNVYHRSDQDIGKLLLLRRQL